MSVKGLLTVPTTVPIKLETIPALAGQATFLKKMNEAVQTLMSVFLLPASSFVQTTRVATNAAVELVTSLPQTEHLAMVIIQYINCY